MLVIMAYIWSGDFYTQILSFLSGVQLSVKWKEVLWAPASCLNIFFEMNFSYEVVEAEKGLDKKMSTSKGYV